MKPLAPERSGARDSTRAVDQTHETTKDAGTAQRADSGVSFLARAESRDGKGRWLFVSEDSSAGRKPLRFIAEGPPSLRPGDLVRAAASAGPGRSAVYRIVDEAAARRTEALNALGLKPDPVSLALVSAARLFGLRIEPHRLRRLYASVVRAVGRGDLDPAEAAFAAASADDKGFDISPDAIASAVRLADPRSGSRGTPERRRGRQQPGLPNAEDLKSAVRGFQAQGSPLSLMNGVSGRSGKRWLVFPLKFFRGSVEICATVSLLLNPSSPEPAGGIEFCSIDISAPSRFWSIEVSGLSGRAEASVRADPPLGPASGSIRAALEKALSPLAASVAVSGEIAVGRRFPIASSDLVTVREDA